MRPNELYRLYSSTDALLYIGITDRHFASVGAAPRRQAMVG